MRGPGYARKNPVTPYIHTMLCHLPELLQHFGSVKMFTGQGKTVNNIIRCLRILTLIYQNHCNQSRQIIQNKCCKCKPMAYFFSVHLNKPDNVHSRILHTNHTGCC